MKTWTHLVEEQIGTFSMHEYCFNASEPEPKYLDKEGFLIIELFIHLQSYQI